MAAVCRHDNVLRLYSIKGTGERQQYAKLLLESIRNDDECPDELFILYDIGCNFSKYLKTRLSADSFSKLKFGVSIFHAYAHDFACQVLYSPRGISGLTHYLLLLIVQGWV
jgi:Kyakuja-Dileera-Zisupton transposase